MTTDKLTATLAERVMRWGVAADRFLLPNREWRPRWRFRPIDNLNDAFRLLEASAPEEYTMGADRDGVFWVQIRVKGVVGEARDTSKARAITLAVARAIGVDVA